ncbi:MAG: alkaline phosphatase family protein [Silvibacterium sp.]
MLGSPAVHLYDEPTVFERLSEAGKTWRIYFSDFSQTILMVRQEAYALNYRYMPSFELDCRDAGNFPQYAFIEPKFFWPGQNDQHPISDIRRGDALIAQVYNAIRKNDDLWNSTLFVILHDEHGGFFDHVDPRQPQYKAKAVPPDSHRTPENFAFDLFGLRVPAVLVSPLLNTGVLHGVYDHTSLLKYLTEKFSLGPLGARVPNANNFAQELVWLDTPRAELPRTLAFTLPPEDPKPTGLSENQEALVSYSRYLESRMANELPPGANKENFLRRVGEPMLKTVEDVTNHGPVATKRLRLFLNSKGAKL